MLQVMKIVQGQFDLFQRMYKPVLEGYAAKELLRFSASSAHHANITQVGSSSFLFPTFIFIFFYFLGG